MAMAKNFEQLLLSVDNWTETTLKPRMRCLRNLIANRENKEPLLKGRGVQKELEMYSLVEWKQLLSRCEVQQDRLKKLKRR